MLIICLLAGALLAQRFKVFVLVPVLALTTVVATVIRLHQQAGVWQIVGSSVVAMVCIQVGYAAGACINYFLVSIAPNSILGRTFSAPASSRRAAN